jgi:uncharacterized protein (DUF2141 family)
MKEDLLDRIGIATPCHISWDSMSGTDRARFCSQCELHVYDISQLSRKEAIALIASTQGRICGRIHRRADGTVLTRDCPVGLRALRRRVARVAGAALAAALSFLSTAAAQSRSQDKDSCKRIPAISVEKKGAQGQQGTVRGAVMDSIGAAVRGAKLRLVNERTKEKLAAESTATGEFVFPDLSKGKYILEIESPGFMSFRLKNLLVESGEELRLTATLQLSGEMTMGIIVTSDPLESLPGTTIITSDMIRRFPH